MAYNVFVIDDAELDGPTLFSPFTGFKPPVDSTDAADPSLVYDFCGEAGELTTVREDVRAIIEPLFAADAEDDDEEDPVEAVRKNAEAAAKKLRESGIRTMTIILPGGWNGVVATCWQVGTIADGEWVAA
jgi:hypothetical protein